MPLKHNVYNFVLLYLLFHTLFQVSDFQLYKDSIVNETQRMLNAIRRNHTACDIALKDVSTVNGNPYNLFQWTELVMRMVEKFEY